MSVTKEPVSSSNPFYGCVIFVIAILTFGGMVGWTLYSGYKQSKEIDAFTVTEAPPLAVTALDDKQRAALQTKLDSFALVAKNGKPVTLTLSLDELNQLVTLAGEKGATDYRGVLHFTKIDTGAQRLVADIRWKLNNLPLSNAKERFLVGTATFRPSVDKGTFDLYIENVLVPGKTVNPGFIGQVANMTWINAATLKPEVTEVFKKIGAFDFSGQDDMFSVRANVGK